jgi:hypothetical protein
LNLSFSLPTFACQRRMQNFFTRGLSMCCPCLNTAHVCKEDDMLALDILSLCLSLASSRAAGPERLRDYQMGLKKSPQNAVGSILCNL